jgi:hypothetical protein
MAELEIHHETEHEKDPMGQRIGVLAAVLAVVLAIVTIASHRTHTAAIMHKSTANDEWSYYQSTRIKLHSAELGAQIVALLGSKEGAASVLATYSNQEQKYEQQSREVQKRAENFDHAAEADEVRALRYDLGEGLLEIALVLSSLYFISKKKMFPVMGIVAGLGGAVIAITGLLL